MEERFDSLTRQIVSFRVCFFALIPARAGFAANRYDTEASDTGSTSVAQERCSAGTERQGGNASGYPEELGGTIKASVTGTGDSGLRREGGDATSPGMPRQLDAIQFAHTHGRLSGDTDVVSLERIAQECSSLPGRIDWSMDGRVDGEGACWLELTLAGSLMLQCQRCLEDVAVGVRSQSRFRLVPAGEPWGDEDLDDDSFEALELDGPLDTRVLIEDEVLLSLPAIALHDQCVAPGPAADGTDGKPSPFAVLGKLKQS